MATRRAFGPNVDRIVRQTTIVYSADDIRRNITLRLDDGAPCQLELGDNITIDRGFTIPGELASFSLDGGDRFNVVVGEDCPFVFKLLGFLLADGGCPVDLRNLTIVLKEGVTVDEVFVVDQAFSVLTLQALALSLSRVLIDATRGIGTDVFALGQTTVGRVVADGLTMLGVDNMFSQGSNLTAWTWCRFTDIVATGRGLAQVTIGQGSTSPAFIECVFMRVAGSITVDTGSFSSENFWAVISGNGSGGFTTHNPTGGRPQTLLRVSNFAPRTLSVDDIDLDDAAATVDIRTFTAAGAATWTKPTSWTPSTVRVVLYGAGGGGGGGASQTGGVVRTGGTGGGGGARGDFLFLASDLAATEAVTVGAGGTAGAGGASGADGTAGGAGGTTTFSAGDNLRSAFGGGGGRFGDNAATSGSGGAGGGLAKVGGNGGATAAPGGGPGAPATPNGGCGANSFAGAGTPVCAEYGGGAGGGHTNVPANGAGGSSLKGGGGGGCGGGATVAPALVNARNGGDHVLAGGAGGAAGTSGAAPTAGTAGLPGSLEHGGCGGGGGGATITANTTGGAGGAGGANGGGGGGGGVGSNTGLGGAGGVGGAGACYVISW